MLTSNSIYYGYYYSLTRIALNIQFKILIYVISGPRAARQFIHWLK